MARGGGGMHGWGACMAGEHVHCRGCVYARAHAWQGCVARGCMAGGGHA